MPPQNKSKNGLFSRDDELNELCHFERELKLNPKQRLWSPTAAAIPALRQSLDDGRMSTLIRRYQKELRQKVLPEPNRLPRRVSLVLLCLCAFALGCRLQDADKLVVYVKANHYTVPIWGKPAKKEALGICKLYAKELPLHSEGHIESSADSYGDSATSIAADSRKHAAEAKFKVTPSSPRSANRKKVLFQKPAGSAAKDTQQANEISENEDGADQQVARVTVTSKSSTDIETPRGGKDEEMEDEEKDGIALKSLDPLVVPTLSKATIAGCINCKGKGHSSGMPLLICGGCKEAIYCDVICQAKNWSEHRKTCRGESGASEHVVMAAKRKKPLSSAATSPNSAPAKKKSKAAV